MSVPVGDFERVGESRPAGWLLLDLLRLNGWEVAAFVANDGHRVTAKRPETSVAASAETFAEAALLVFKEAAGWHELEQPQLSFLPLERARSSKTRNRAA